MVLLLSSIVRYEAGLALHWAGAGLALGWQSKQTTFVEITFHLFCSWKHGTKNLFKSNLWFGWNDANYQFSLHLCVVLSTYLTLTHNNTPTLPGNICRHAFTFWLMWISKNIFETLHWCLLDDYSTKLWRLSGNNKLRWFACKCSKKQKLKVLTLKIISISFIHIHNAFQSCLRFRIKGRNKKKYL